MDNVTCRDVSDSRGRPNKKMTMAIHVFTNSGETLTARQFHADFRTERGTPSAVAVDQELRVTAPLSHSQS